MRALSSRALGAPTVDLVREPCFGLNSDRRTAVLVFRTNGKTTGHPSSQGRSGIY